MNEDDFIYEEYQIFGCGLMVNSFVRKLYSFFKNHCKKEEFFKRKEKSDLDAETTLEFLLIEKKNFIKGKKKKKRFKWWRIFNMTKKL